MVHMVYCQRAIIPETRKGLKTVGIRVVSGSQVVLVRIKEEIQSQSDHI